MINTEGVPVADGISIASCDDPNCGPHIILLDERGEGMALIAIPVDMALGLVKAIQGILYAKGVERDDPTHH